MGEIIEMDGKGRISIPKQVREQLGLSKSSKLEIEIVGNCIVLQLTEAKHLIDYKEERV